jgi:hypothetical protein
VEQEISKLENAFWQTMKDKDVEAALELTDDPCLVSGPAGVARVDHEKFAQLMAGAKWDLKRFEITDVHVQQIDENVAVVAYKVHEELTVDGKPITVDCSDSSTWVRRDHHWVCALHSEAVAGDAFGRDRMKQ